MKLIVGTRGSRLSLIQTNFVVKKLIQIFPSFEVETQIIKTAGDRFASEPLQTIKEKGIFEKEIDLAVIEDKIDFAVHSIKDIPTEPPKGISIVAVPKRDSPYDALVSMKNLSLKELPAGAVVGTGSPRRTAQILALRPDIKIEPIRGNVDTRIRKLEQGLFDALILAEAGLKRLNLNHIPAERLPVESFTPAPGQGALAIVAREKDEKTIDILSRINHPPTMTEILSERAFIREVGGGCKVPIGALARAQKDELKLYASLSSPDGRFSLRAADTGQIESPEKLGIKLAHRMMKQGAGELIQYWRSIDEER